MENISIKIEEGLSKEMEKAMSPMYATKTEFIREAIREKIQSETKRKRLERIRENFGKGKGIAMNNLSDREIRELAFEELVKEKGW